MDNVEIRYAEISDIPAMVAVRHDAILNTKNEYYDPSALIEWAGAPDQRVQKMLLNKNEIRIVAELNKKIVGYGALVVQDNDLSACYVLSDLGRKGIGRTIITSLENLAKAQNLTYLQMESSANAEHFYIRCGFYVVERGVHIMNSGMVMNNAIMRKELRDKDR